jgi:hypothetical protein
MRVTPQAKRLVALALKKGAPYLHDWIFNATNALAFAKIPQCVIIGALSGYDSAA